MTKQLAETQEELKQTEIILAKLNKEVAELNDILNVK